MSAEQTTSRYRAEDTFRSSMRRFRVIDDRGDSMTGAPMFVDSFQTRSGAEYAARLLNSGMAVVNSHGTLGCRVEVRNG